MTFARGRILSCGSVARMVRCHGLVRSHVRWNRVTDGAFNQEAALSSRHPKTHLFGGAAGSRRYPRRLGL